VAYWIGNYLAAPPPPPPGAPPIAAGKIRMRVSYIFEKRCPKPDAKAKDQPKACRWTLVQAHMSQPITDEELTRQIYGSAVTSTNPLALDCSDHPPATPRRAPAEAPTPPTARSRQSP
jgi:hypothetical protein